MTTKQKILFVLTSRDKLLNGEPTGWYLPEAAHPYYVLSPSFDIDFAAPAGPNPPVDPCSFESFKQDDISVKFFNDDVVKSKLRNATKLSDVVADDYHALFYPGGHGPIFDLAVDPENIRLATHFFQSGKLVGAVCHGQAALIGVTCINEVTPVFKGRNVTCFSNVEEQQTGKEKAIPFLIEDVVRLQGGFYEKASEPWAAHVVADGQLFTGQNPASAGPLAQSILKALILNKSGWRST
ncbi:class I glutamine amidotransferase-like protein [Fistulina hepatica ATCC 64428]|uniref:D-lactate dehydratase n=1 Tax=Fistulina hepatica ATCC 64428 TaxID=1128425 RepID=A0A0D7AJ42_9AGAR|nr:class I glutamine amidotransferase-like protein [Fistulina hepatica ATCC 64428]